MNRVNLTREQVRHRIQAMPKKIKYLTRYETRKRIERLVILRSFNALRS